LSFFFILLVLLKNSAKGAAGFAAMAVVFEKAFEHFGNAEH
jgi:hypothetical protein